jgi:hypothetical protein
MVVYDDKWKVHVDPLSLENVEVTDIHICARIKQDGVFLPIKRSDLFRDTYRNNMFMYIAMGAYGFLFLFAVVMLIIVWTKKNKTSVFMYEYRKWKSLVIATVMFIAVIRAVSTSLESVILTF